MSTADTYEPNWPQDQQLEEILQPRPKKKRVRLYFLLLWLTFAKENEPLWLYSFFLADLWFNSSQVLRSYWTEADPGFSSWGGAPVRKWSNWRVTNKFWKWTMEKKAYDKVIMVNCRENIPFTWHSTYIPQHHLVFYFNINKPQFFFSFLFAKYWFIRNLQVISGGRGAHPLHPSPRSSPVSLAIILLTTQLGIYLNLFV